MQIMNYFPSFM